MTNEEALKILRNTDFCYSDLCEAVQVAVKSLEKDIKKEDETEVVFSGTRVHYELRNKTDNFRFKFKFDEQKSQEGIRNWFKENHSSAYLPEGKYVIVKVTDTEKVEVVEELEEV